MGTSGVESDRFLGLDIVQREQVYLQARDKRNTLQGYSHVFCAVKNQIPAAYVLDYQFGTVTNEYYGIFWGGGALVLHVVRVVGHVHRRPVVCDPALYPPSQTIVLTDPSRLSCEQM